MSENILENTNGHTTAAHDDFDWTVDKRNVVRYTAEESAVYDKQYSSTLKTIENDEIVKGTVVAITNTDVVLNIGFKSDGLVPLSEFRDLEEVKIGDEFDVYVVNIKFIAEYESAYTLTLVNALGKTVEQRAVQYTQGENFTTLATDNLPQGIYFIRLHNGKASYSQKIIVQ